MTPVWWLLGFLPALLLLYFLKLKRRDAPVPSTLLWRRSLEDLHVNAPFQRLRRSLLFLLQLLVLVLLILGVWRPRCDTTQLSGRDVVVLVDVSASMKARDGDGLRMERARKEALGIARSLDAGDRMMVLAFASRVETVQPLTSDTALLESRIGGLQATDLPTDLAAGLRTAQSLAEPLPGAEVVVIGDGGYADLEDLPLEVERQPYRLVSVGKPAQNAGIVEADVRRSFGRTPRVEVFALVRSRLEEARTASLTLRHEDTLVDAREVDLAPGSASPVVFDVTGLRPGLVTLELDIDDALEVDDHAWVEILPRQELSVLVVGEENPWLDLALRSDTRLSWRRLAPSAFGEAEARSLREAETPPVVIFDRWAPESVPAVPALFIGCHPELPEGVPEPTRQEAPVVIDWDRTHPVNRDLHFGPLSIGEGLVFGESGEHLRPLVESDQGVIIGVLLRSEPGRSPRPSIVVGFDVLESNWPLGHYSFPIFFSNAIEWLGTRYEAKRARWRTGQPLVIAPEAVPEGDAPEVRTPGGEEATAAREPGGAAVFGRTDQAGIYEVLVDGETTQRFGVALLSDAESDLTPQPSVAVGEIEVRAEEELAAGTHELWPWLVLAGLAVLLAEWYVFHRRALV